MKIKVIVLVATVAILHLVLVGLFLSGGCAQEDAPMPPGVYAPPTKDAGTVAQPKSTSPASVITPASGESSISTPSESAHGAKEEKAIEKKHIEKTGNEATHKVGKGESLWSISKKYSVTIEELALYNNIPATAKLKIGQTVLIPPAGKAVKAPAAKTPAAKTHAAAKSEAKAPAAKTAAKSHAAKKGAAKESVPADGSYAIKAGDNFSTLAKKFGVKSSEIAAANPGIDSSKLKIGQKINLPGASASGAVATAAPAAVKPAAEGATAAPAAAKSANIDSLLEDIPNPDAAPAAAKTAESAPVASTEAVKAVAPAAAAAPATGDADKLEDLADGTGVAVTTGSETTLAKLAVKYKVKEADVKLLNPSIPADGTIKAGMVIKLP